MGYYLESSGILHGHFASIQGLKLFREMLIKEKKKYPALHELITEGESGKIKEMSAELVIASQTYAKHPNHKGLLKTIAYSLKDIMNMKQGKGLKDIIYLTQGDW